MSSQSSAPELASVLEKRILDLERQLVEHQAHATATAEILRAIEEAKGEVQPVFDRIARSAAELCAARFCMLWRYDGQLLHYCSSHGFPAEFMRDYLANYPAPPAEQGIIWPVLASGQIAHIEDAHSDDYADHETARAFGYRRMTAAPILSGDRIWGLIVLGWPLTEAPSSSHIDLIQSFAEQASIAIENARLFNEVQVRLAREAATREILEVISQSRDNEQPVFEVVLRKSAHLCGASMASLNIVSEDRSYMVKMAEWGDQNSDQLPAGTTVWQIESGNAPAVCVREGRIVHLHDMADTDLYRSGDAMRVAAVDSLGIRTFLAVPLFSGGRTVGCISVYRHQVKPFATDEIALLETFAAQAVIAIENVRQFKALERLNAELGDRVEAQVGEIERMGKLKRFLPSAVANAVVTSGSEKLLSSHRALLAVLFCDIRGFTAFCETAEPEETIEVLQTYHEEMGKLINAHGAGVDHRMGDGIMVLFNDPLPCDDPAGEAVQLAIAMRRRMAELGQIWRRLGHRLGFGVGVSLGYATVGMVGFEGRFDYTASGTAINLASRLCDEAIDGEILLSPRASIAVEDRFPVESRGEITLKGIREPVEVFRLTHIVAA